MVVEGLIFWGILYVVVELSVVQQVRYQLTLCLGGILLVVCLLFRLEVDVLGALVLGAYTSVFVALFLLALHFGQHVVGGLGAGRWWAVLGVVALPLLWVVGGPVVGGTALPWGVLWQDQVGGGAQHATAHLHLFFFKVYVVETLLLNLYLFLGLVAALALLVAARVWADLVWVGRNGRAIRSGGGLSTPTNVRLRQVARFRRQTRRTVATRLRTLR